MTSTGAEIAAALHAPLAEADEATSATAVAPVFSGASAHSDPAVSHLVDLTRSPVGRPAARGSSVPAACSRTADPSDVMRDVQERDVAMNLATRTTGPDIANEWQAGIAGSDG